MQCPPVQPDSAVCANGKRSERIGVGPANSPNSQSITSAPLIVVCVATCGRPAALAQCLKELTSSSGDIDFAIVVCDNDAVNPLGAAFIHDLLPQAIRPASYIVEQSPGIPAARNRMISHAIDNYPSASWIAMIDDDEIPSAGWLQNLATAGEAANAEIICGPQLYIAESDPPPWLPKASSLIDHARQGAGEIGRGLSTGNVMISILFLQSMERPWFRGAFAKSGGSDVDFFCRSSDAGAKTVFSPEAKTYEICTGSRLTKRWWLQRMLRNGSIEARIMAINATPTERVGWLFHHTVRSVGGATLQLVSPQTSFRTLGASLRLYWLFGYITGSLGIVEEWYKGRG